jgi:RNA 2',3'-cyclic 3'-phosphodiesterase
MENKTIRSFFALPLSDLCRQNLAEIIQGLKKEMPPVIKWMDIDNIHLTLKFLGDIKPEDINIMKKKLEFAFSGFDEFSLKIFNLGVFPNERKPKIIWVGASYPDPLKQLFSIVEETAFLLGYSKEQRDFTPHITLGRVRYNVSYQNLLKIGGVLHDKKDCEICISKAAELSFIKSELRPSGPVYSELFSLAFKQ